MSVNTLRWTSRSVLAGLRVSKGWFAIPGSREQERAFVCGEIELRRSTFIPTIICFSYTNDNTFLYLVHPEARLTGPRSARPSGSGRGSPLADVCAIGSRRTRRATHVPSSAARRFCRKQGAPTGRGDADDLSPLTLKTESDRASYQWSEDPPASDCLPAEAGNPAFDGRGATTRQGSARSVRVGSDRSATLAPVTLHAGRRLPRPRSRDWFFPTGAAMTRAAAPAAPDVAARDLVSATASPLRSARSPARR